MGKKKPDKIYSLPAKAGGYISLHISHEAPQWVQGKIIQLLETKEGVPVRSSRFSKVLQFQNPETGEIIYYKEFYRRGLKDVLKNIAGYTRARKEYEGGKMLTEKGFLTPASVLYGFTKRYGMIQNNFLVTKEAPGQQTYQYIRERFTQPLTATSVTEKRAFLVNAGSEIGRLHSKGIFHGDLRVGNILIEGFGSSALFYFLDNERTKLYPSLPERKRLKNLVQLNMVRLPQITRTDRLRFLLAYMNCNPDLFPSKKRILRKIQELTTQKRHLKKN